MNQGDSKDGQSGQDSIWRKNYNLLNEFAPDILSGDSKYMTFEQDVNNRVTLERIGKNEISITHFDGRDT